MLKRLEVLVVENEDTGDRQNIKKDLTCISKELSFQGLCLQQVLLNDYVIHHSCHVTNRENQIVATQRFPAILDRSIQPIERAQAHCNHNCADTQEADQDNEAPDGVLVYIVMLMCADFFM